MRLPTKARSKSFLTTVFAGVLLVGCAGESTAPTAATTPLASQSRTSPFAPSAAAKALVGVSDGTYQFTVDPRKSQMLVLGSNALVIPGNAICDLQSSYGAGHWDEKCAPETSRLTITAVVRNARSSHPSIDFYPAMRFAPDKNVSLYMYVPAAERDDKHNFVMKYCNDDKVCVDESLLDPSLATMTDRTGGIVFRRIKHFSGYIVAGFMQELTGLL